MSVYDINGNPLCGDDTSDLEDLLHGRLLVWHDEFDGEFDQSKWQTVYGYSSNHGGFMYPKNINRNTSCDNGLSYYALKDYPIQNATFSCPYITSNNLFEFKYGRIEAKIKFPSVSPHHSTFWTLGACNDRLSIAENEPFNSTVGVKTSSCGEIDIAEFDNGIVGARTYWDSSGFDAGGTAARGGNIDSLTSTAADWHIYSAEWTDSSITFFVDGVQKGTWNTSNATVNGWNPFSHPHYIILNCVPYLSGSPTWDVAETQVKWVRVYAPVGVTEYITETAISIPASASISVGERHWLGTPTFTPSNPSDMTIKWESMNDSVVTCYGGMLIGVSAGTTFVKAASKHGCYALCKVTVS